MDLERAARQVVLDVEPEEVAAALGDLELAADALDDLRLQGLVAHDQHVVYVQDNDDAQRARYQQKAAPVECQAPEPKFIEQEL